MSKNFEEEYKALADQELPDLWDRIEEGLAPRSTPKEPVKKSTKIVQFVRLTGGCGLCSSHFTCRNFDQPEYKEIRCSRPYSK